MKKKSLWIYGIIGVLIVVFFIYFSKINSKEFTIISPNGDETWIASTTQKITVYIPKQIAKLTGYEISFEATPEPAGDGDSGSYYPVARFPLDGKSGTIEYDIIVPRNIFDNYSQTSSKTFILVSRIQKLIKCEDTPRGRGCQYTGSSLDTSDKPITILNNKTSQSE